MNDKLTEALNNIEITYKELIEISNSFTKSIFDPIDQLVNDISLNINSMSIDQLRNYMLQLQLKAYSISEIKEKAALKAEIADSLQKEKFAINFTTTDGTAGNKTNSAQIAVSQEIVSKTLYELVANLLKTKVDQLHRLVAVLTSTLMSRMSEAKFMNLGVTNEIPATTNGKVQL